MIWDLIFVVIAFAAAAEAQSPTLDADTALYILYGILGVSALVCLLFIVCITCFCCKICQQRRERRPQRGDGVGVVSEERRHKKSTRPHRLFTGSNKTRNISNMSLPLAANPAYEQFTPPGSEGNTISKFVGSAKENSLTDLNMEIFRPSMLDTKVLEAETPITPDIPQGFDRTPLLSKQSRAGEPRSIPAIQVEVEQERVQYSTATALKDDPNITRTSISPRPRPRSQGPLSDSRLSAGPSQRHSSALKPTPFSQNHLKPVGPAQSSPRTKRSQKYMDFVAASSTPKSKRQYSPALARKKDVSKMKGSSSSPGQLKHINLDPKATDKNSRQKLDEDWSETLNYMDEVLNSI